MVRPPENTRTGTVPGTKNIIHLNNKNYMWPSFTENPEIVRAIYRDEIPPLQNVYLQELKIVNGEDIQCYLKFDIWELPKIQPEKWIERNVNAVQIELILVNSEILFFELGGSNLSGKLEIDLVGDYKKVSISINGRIVFVIRSKWLNVQSIIGK